MIDRYWNPTGLFVTLAILGLLVAAGVALNWSASGALTLWALAVVSKEIQHPES